MGISSTRVSSIQVTARRFQNTDVFFRPIHEGDETALARFRTALSADTVYQRYFAPVSLSDEALNLWAEHLVGRQPHRQVSMVAVDKGGRVLGLLELAPDPSAEGRAEIAIVIGDRYQRQGIGTALGQYATRQADQWGIEEIVACMLGTNRGAQRLIRHLGFPCEWESDGELKFAKLKVH